MDEREDQRRIDARTPSLLLAAESSNRWRNKDRIPLIVNHACFHDAYQTTARFKNTQVSKFNNTIGELIMHSPLESIPCKKLTAIGLTLSLSFLNISALPAQSKPVSSEPLAENIHCLKVDMGSTQESRRIDKLHAECFIINLKNAPKDKRSALDLSGERFFPPACGNASFCYEDIEMKDKLFADRETSTLQDRRKIAQDALIRVSEKINEGKVLPILKQRGKVEHFCRSGGSLTVGRIFSNTAQLDMYLNEARENTLHYLRNGICDVTAVILVFQKN